MIVIARPLGGTSLNGLEFLLDGPNGNHKLFKDEIEAKTFIREEIFPDSTDEEINGYFTFMTQEEAIAYEVE